jgi:PhzF family phenazine biosynthesis protein
MSKLRLYQIDAFTDRRFGGNPAAVVPLERWLDDAVLQAVALENNLAETAYFVPDNDGCRLRWFTPTVEVDLCGHATLASAFVLFTELEPGRSRVTFETRSGPLHVRAAGERLVMDFPRWPLAAAADGLGEPFAAALGAVPRELYTTAAGSNFFAVLDDEAAVRALRPDMRALAAFGMGAIVTARGTVSDCVCRYFAPSFGIDEDAGTGSIHCALTPYWTEHLGKPAIHSRQLSRRGADLYCELDGERVAIAGSAVKYLEGWIEV